MDSTAVAPLASTPGALPAGYRMRPSINSGSDGNADGYGAAKQQQLPAPVDTLLSLLLHVVRPLDEAGFAYCAVRRTAAWLQGVSLPLRSRHYIRGSADDSNSTSSGRSAAGGGRNDSSQSSSRGGGGSDTTCDSSCESGVRSTPITSSHDLVVSPPPPPPPMTTATTTHQAVSIRAMHPAGGSDGGGDGGGVQEVRGELRPQQQQQTANGEGPPELELEVQWDQMQTIHDLFGEQGASAGPGWLWRTSPLRHLPGGSAFFTMTSPEVIARSGTTTTTTAGAATAPVATTTTEFTVATADVYTKPEGTTAIAGRNSIWNDASSHGEGSSGALVSSGPGGTPPLNPGGSKSEAVFARVTISCTYNTTLRARPDRLLITPRPPIPPLSTELGTVQLTASTQEPGDGRNGTADCSNTTDGMASGAVLGSFAVSCEGCPGADQPRLAVLTASTGPYDQERPSVGAPGVWSQSLYSVAVEAARSGDSELATAVRGALRNLQRVRAEMRGSHWSVNQSYLLPTRQPGAEIRRTTPGWRVLEHLPRRRRGCSETQGSAWDRYCPT
ncbi:hypothetical protein Vafri_13669 [Volvox africanus]|uniref:Uncharacterized protein n=1 Tax=Volvox africanus TaxID=51714 RepID=A0A8J4F2S5_9CHLO|nr:hypothetical protein Vafri_13669 [Volvox africanus]